MGRPLGATGVWRVSYVTVLGPDRQWFVTKREAVQWIDSAGVVAAVAEPIPPPRNRRELVDLLNHGRYTHGE